MKQTLRTALVVAALPSMVLVLAVVTDAPRAAVLACVGALVVAVLGYIVLDLSATDSVAVADMDGRRADRAT